MLCFSSVPCIFNSIVVSYMFVLCPLGPKEIKTFSIHLLQELLLKPVMPTLLYGAGNWILDETSLNFLEKFQAEIGRWVLRLSRFHSQYSVLLAMSWPSMEARSLKLNLEFLFRQLSSEDDNVAWSIFPTLASQDMYIPSWDCTTMHCTWFQNRNPICCYCPKRQGSFKDLAKKYLKGYSTKDKE